jgi:superfamily II DNA/RNA helicase
VQRLPELVSSPYSPREGHELVVSAHGTYTGGHPAPLFCLGPSISSSTKRRGHEPAPGRTTPQLSEFSMAVSRPSTMSTSSSAPVPQTFADLGLPRPLVDALAAAGVTTPFPIQAGTLPDSLSGRDVLGRGRTGSGKTYAFLLPLVTRLSQSRSKRRAGRPRGLILAPTRELARQIDVALAPLARALSLRTVTVFGGVPANPQIRALREGVDIVVACPGRLADLVQSGHADLDGVDVTVLDEADHMADLGFLPVVRRLLDKTPRRGQRLLFSATLDGGVDVLVKRYLDDPVVHSVDSARSPVATMDHHVLHVDSDSRLTIIADLAAAPGRTVVFTRTKHGAKALARKLNSIGVAAVELHGNLSQNARARNLDSFAGGTASTLVATDIAARGIHVDDVTLVIHADPPVEHKAYLHRSGRTARAGASGTVVTMMVDAQVRDVRDLTRRAGIKPLVTKVGAGHPLLTTIAPGDRTYTAPPTRTAATPGSTGAGSRRPVEGRARGRGRRNGAGRGGGRAGRPTATPAGDGAGRAGSAASQTVRTSGGHSAATFSAAARRR